MQKILNQEMITMLSLSFSLDLLEAQEDLDQVVVPVVDPVALTRKIPRPLMRKPVMLSRTPLMTPKPSAKNGQAKFAQRRRRMTRRRSVKQLRLLLELLLLEPWPFWESPHFCDPS
jgi:hypothetical protein